jgi:hypothetical protein
MRSRCVASLLGLALFVSLALFDRSDLFVARLHAAAVYDNACKGDLNGAASASCTMTVAAGSAIIWSMNYTTAASFTTNFADGGNTGYVVVGADVASNLLRQSYGYNCSLTTTGSRTFTATMNSGTAFGGLYVTSVTGLATSSCLDGSAVHVLSTTPATGADTITTGGGAGQLTPSQNGDYIYGATVEDSFIGTPTLTAGTTPNAFTARQTQTANDLRALTEEFVQATAANLSITFGHNSATSSYAIIGMAFKVPTAASGLPPNGLSLLGAGR